jgi:hypothetical protein
MDRLLAQLARRARDPKRAVDTAADTPSRRRAARRPLGEATLVKAEARIGRRLAPFLRALYRQVGNGGFGPSYGLLGLVGGARDEDDGDAVTLYERHRADLATDPLWRWPEYHLPLVQLGCGMFLCADATSDDSPIIWFEPNPHEDGKPWDDAFYPMDITLRRLLEGWVGRGYGDIFRRAWLAKNPGEEWDDGD